MLTGTTFEAVAILALIAVAHTVISTVIAKRLSAGEKASGQNSGATGVSTTAIPVFGSTPANDQFSRAA
jgi:MFS superfamily sulfate permease-like transporter